MKMIEQAKKRAEQTSPALRMAIAVAITTAAVAITAALAIADQAARKNPQAFEAHLYFLNPAGTWSPVHSDQLAKCREPMKCAVIFFPAAPGTPTPPPAKDTAGAMWVRTAPALPAPAPARRPDAEQSAPIEPQQTLRLKR